MQHKFEAVDIVGTVYPFDELLRRCARLVHVAGAGCYLLRFPGEHARVVTLRPTFTEFLRRFGDWKLTRDRRATVARGNLAKRWSDAQDATPDVPREFGPRADKAIPILLDALVAPAWLGVPNPNVKVDPKDLETWDRVIAEPQRKAQARFARDLKHLGDRIRKL